MLKRYTDTELEGFLDDLESDRVERKETFKGDVPKKARQAICAFANDLPGHDEPGVLFIGAKDDGSPSGLSVTDELLRSLADMKTDGNILPLPTLVVEKRHLKEADMAVITVHPSDMPPVRYDGRIWIRTGPRRGLASAQDERLLNERRRYKIPFFDLAPVPSARLSDLSRLIFENEYLPAAFAPDVLEANGRSYEERLASCKMIAAPDDPTTGLPARGLHRIFADQRNGTGGRCDGCGDHGRQYLGPAAQLAGKGAGAQSDRRGHPFRSETCHHAPLSDSGHRPDRLQRCPAPDL